MNVCVEQVYGVFEQNLGILAFMLNVLLWLQGKGFSIVTLKQRKLNIVKFSLSENLIDKYKCIRKL